MEKSNIYWGIVGIAGLVGMMVLAAVLGVITARSSGGTGASGALVGTLAPPIQGTTPDGQDIDLSDYEGEVVLVDFWATWCPPCRSALPRIQAIADDYADRGVRVIGVSGDTKSSDLATYVEDNNITFPTIFYGAEDVMRSYGIRGFPTVAIIDQEGKIAWMGHHGDYRRQIDRLLD